MKFVISLLVAVLMTGCALNPRLENQEPFNGKIVRVKVSHFTAAKAGFDAHPKDYEWYKAMNPNHTPIETGDTAVFFNTNEGASAWFKGRILEERLMRQYVILRKDEMAADPALFKIKVGDILDVQMPYWNHQTKSRSGEIKITEVVCRKSDSDCINKRASCLGIVNPKTDSACE